VELTLESAFSSQGALGHAAYLLLVLSMLMRKMFWLRVLVIASAVVAIAYASLVLTDPVSTFWETMLIVVNIGQLTLTWWLDRRTQFDSREERLRKAHFPRLAPSRLRRLLRAGEWVDLPAGTQLTRAGDPVPALWFLHEGRAQVVVAGVAVGQCLPDSFIGEMTVATGEPAFADVMLDTDAPVWRIDAKRLRDLASRDTETGYALEAAFFRMIRQKLADSNDWSRAHELQSARSP
jgi:CRP-like cAMP-binding protein